jgi:TolB-like protein
MRKTLLVAALGTMGMTLHAQNPDLRPGVAVLPFENAAMQPELATLTKGFQAMLTSELANNGRIRLVDRDNMQRILDEQGLGSRGQLDPQTIVRVGKIVGARYMITGTYMTDSKRMMTIIIKAFDVETSEILFSDNTTKGKSDEMTALVVKASQLANSKLNLPQLPAGSPAAREASAKSEQTKKMPLAAAVLYARALEAQDSGKKDEAITLYKQVVDKFPYPPAQDALTKLGAK